MQFGGLLFMGHPVYVCVYSFTFISASQSARNGELPALLTIYGLGISVPKIIIIQLFFTELLWM